MALRWVLATAAALVAGAAWCPPAGAVVGGVEVANISQVPYQVGLVHAGTNAADRDGQYCGGVVRDEWHIITAAHCVYNAATSGKASRPGDVDVLAGTKDLRDEAGHRFHVSKISYMSYNALTYADDAALLTLADPLPEDDITIERVKLIEDDWAGINEPTSPVSLDVTGWGATTPGGNLATVLHTASVNYVRDGDCDGAYIFQAPAVQVCAIAPGRDACNGDSGGPLVLHDDPSSPASDRLVGIVSAGGNPQQCGNTAFPGLYTEVAAPTIKAFLEQPDPTDAARSTSPPILSGQAVVGERLTCDPGGWTGDPSLTYQFVRSSGGADVGIGASGPQPQYAVTAQDVGTSLRCVVTGRNPGGGETVESNRTAVVPAPAQPQPEPQPQPQPQPTPQPPQTSLDVYAPVAKVAKTRCTSTRCTLTVSVRDAGFSAGIQTVKASVKSTYRTTCKRKGKKRKVACTKTKTGRASVRALSATRFKVVASKLPIGKQVFTLIAVDKAGHRQALPTRKTVTTKKPKKKSSTKRR